MIFISKSTIQVYQTQIYILHQNLMYQQEKRQVLTIKTIFAHLEKAVGFLPLMCIEKTCLKII